LSGTEIQRVFECFGLLTEEQRNKILSQGSMVDFEKSLGLNFKTWISNGTDEEYMEGGANAKLENDFR